MFSLFLGQRFYIYGYGNRKFQISKALPYS